MQTLTADDINRAVVIGRQWRRSVPRDARHGSSPEAGTDLAPSCH